MIDPQAALASAIANSRQAQAAPIQPALPLHPGIIHAMASQLASHIANARQPLGRATTLPAPPRDPYGPFGGIPNGMGGQTAGVQIDATPFTIPYLQQQINSYGYTYPTGNPGY